MKKLYVMRHAKSSWDDCALSDFERPLNERGLRTAPLVGELMKQNQFQIDIIISSPAERARQTAVKVKEAASFGSDVIFDEKIYEASPQRLLNILSEIVPTISAVLLVGHNPGLEDLIRILTGALEPMPTAALAVIDLNIENWNELTADTGKLVKVFRPKEEF